MQTSKEKKLSTMIFFTLIFFVLELVSGYYTGSVALIADSFHMLSDVAALFIALFATRLAKKRNVGVEFSYGLQRAEVLGALINGISLLALSFTLIIEAIQRFFKPSEIETPWIVLIVGSAGLGVNIIGIFLFHDHSHHPEMMPIASSERVIAADAALEVDHPVQLGEKVIRVAALMQHDLEDIEEMKVDEVIVPMDTRSQKSMPEASNSLEAGNSNSHSHHEHSQNDQSHEGHDHSHDHQNSHHGHSHSDMNMHGVFLHILGDLLGSVGVIFSALVIIYASGTWTLYIDPLISLFITLLIVKSTVPMVKSACYILLQRTPSSVSVDSLRQDILQIEGVLGVHELHVWQLSEAQTIASVHILVPRPAEMNDGKVMEERYMDLATKVKARLHAHGVHSTTVQPEFVTTEDRVK